MSERDAYWANVWFRLRRMLLVIGVFGALGALALVLSQSQHWLHGVGAASLGIAGGLLVVLPLFLVGGYRRARRMQ